MSSRAVARLAARGSLSEVRVSPRKVFYRAADVLTVMGETPEHPSPPKRTKHERDLEWEFADHPYPIRDVTPT
ncbi:hypothetical protein [Roseimicrobium sp. ORNL1]|uniref:hypothetical protein n=1 Tax=Roseimicrobium sp. ORNL1 TaxID=2711231 RepID=UPI0013E1D4E4|nr:hypothetical protein [Roseimicrobium sp. ORNL1]QIF01643.1 hypothetical protein G5S37_08940 [Roseimicrobium sp. ORNL1]